MGIFKKLFAQVYATESHSYNLYADQLFRVQFQYNFIQQQTIPIIANALEGAHILQSYNIITNMYLNIMRIFVYQLFSCTKNHCFSQRAGLIELTVFVQEFTKFPDFAMDNVHPLVGRESDAVALTPLVNVLQIVANE